MRIMDLDNGLNDSGQTLILISYSQTFIDVVLLFLSLYDFHFGSSPPAGQHDCVTVINNFFSRARLDYYTKAQGLEKEPKLPTKLAGPLHKVIMSTNLNPVKVKLDVYC